MWVDIDSCGVYLSFWSVVGNSGKLFEMCSAECSTSLAADLFLNNSGSRDLSTELNAENIYF